LTASTIPIYGVAPKSKPQTSVHIVASDNNDKASLIMTLYN